MVYVVTPFFVIFIYTAQNTDRSLSKDPKKKELNHYTMFITRRGFVGYVMLKGGRR